MLATRVAEGSSNDERVYALVKQLLLVLAPAGLGEAIDRASLLIDDVGLDSLKFVDLTVGLERTLGVREFPMQRWIDDLMDSGLPMTVGALVSCCEDLLREQQRS
jgi:acyl carrier protein